MAIFREEEVQQLDWLLLQNSPITLYFRPEILEADLSWLRERKYHIAVQSRRFLLFGLRLMALVQSNDPRILFDPVGACPVGWNGREWLNKSRGL